MTEENKTEPVLEEKKDEKVDEPTTVPPQNERPSEPSQNEPSVPSPDNPQMPRHLRDEAYASASANEKEEKKEEPEVKEEPVKDEKKEIKAVMESDKDSKSSAKPAEPKTEGNPMKKIKIEKITLNIGVGKSEDMLKKGLKLLQKLSPVKPVKTLTQKRIPGWGLRPGLAIGCMVTIRKDCDKLLKRLLVAKENVLKERNFDNNGNFSFGIPEYIDIEGLDYDPDLKILGLEAAVTLERPGFRIKKKKILSGKIGKLHQISREDAIKFIQTFGVEVQ